MKKRPRVCLLPALLAALLLATACAAPADDSQSMEEPPAPPTPQQMEPAELRGALADLSGAEQLVYYEELAARGLLEEQDYTAMAQLYADAGDETARRQMLWQALHLYPKEEYVEALHALVVETGPDNAAVAALVQSVTTALEAWDAAALRALIGSADWAVLQEAPELYATRTRYTTPELTVQIETDSFETAVTLLYADGRYGYVRCNAAGAILASAAYADGAFDGAAEVVWFDETDTAYKRYTATLRQDLCVGDLQVEYEGVAYAGTLDETGAPTAAQESKITAAGGVIYAWQVGGNRYLYWPDTTRETFRLDSAALGLPTVELWP